MKNKQQGGSGWTFLWIVFTVCWFAWIATDFLPADAESLQALVKLAEKSPAAKAELASGLKATPNPDRSDLAKISKRVNEILVTETARQVTGDISLQTPSEKDAQQTAERLAFAEQVEAKAWSSMSGQEKVQYLSNHWPIAALAMAIVLGWIIGTRGISGNRNSY